MPFAYDVRCSFEDMAARDAFARWLDEQHVGDVLASGAASAAIVLVDGGPPFVVAVHYGFASREAYEAYLRDHAPARRAEGLAMIARLGDPKVAFARDAGPMLVR